jgi:predicted metal-dependent hydrolase
MEYKIKKSKRAKRIRISISHDKGIVVTIPRGFSERIADKFIKEKEDWIKSKMKLYSGIERNQIKSSKKDYLNRKEEVRSLILKRISFLDLDKDFKFNRIAIKNTKTRWGSCSMKKNLNFNYRMIYLPENLIDYIIVHELCHLKEMNHSKNFWDLVSNYCPECKECRKELKKYLL